MKTDDGGSAFPSSDFDGEDHWPKGGMSLRDWFAGMALQGYMAGTRENEPWELCFGEAAVHCFQVADAMIKERKQ